MESDGVFNHAKAGHIQTATRKDGTISVWDHWHTSLFAYLAGIDYLRIDNYNHEDSDLEKARMLEQEFFYSKNGRKFISNLKNKEIFLDLKLNDIPNTCVASINSLKDLKNISYITVHINGGYEMLKAIKKASKLMKAVNV